MIYLHFSALFLTVLITIYPSVKSTKNVPAQQWAVRKKALYPVMRQVAAHLLKSDEDASKAMPQEVIHPLFIMMCFLILIYLLP